MIYAGSVAVVNTVGALARTSGTGALVVARSAAVAGERRFSKAGVQERWRGVKNIRAVLSTGAGHR
jgi:hypothetical protein